MFRVKVLPRNRPQRAFDGYQALSGSPCLVLAVAFILRETFQLDRHVSLHLQNIRNGYHSTVHDMGSICYIRCFSRWKKCGNCVNRKVGIMYAMGSVFADDKGTKRIGNEMLAAQVTTRPSFLSGHTVFL